MSATLSYGLGAGGMVRMRLPEIRRAIFDDLRQRTGLTFDETPDSLTGQFVAVFAEREAALWELAEATYLSAYPATAQGVALDLAVGYSGVVRTQASPSSVRLILFGTQGTNVPAGSVVQSTFLPEGEATYPRFGLDADVLITRDALANVLFVVGAAASGSVYALTYNGAPVSYTATGSDTQATIANALRGQLAALGATVTSTGPNVRVTSLGTFAATAGSNVTIGQMGSPGTASSLETGPIPGPAGTLTKITTPVTGWASVTNVADADLGTRLETDDELRARYRTGVYRLGAGTVPSIRANLLQDVAGITSAAVYENTTDAPDGDGRPPHSMEAVVEGGSADLIAQVIFRTKPAGIQAYGNTVRQVPDDTGYVHNIAFSRPESRFVWVRAVLTTTSEEPIPGDVAIRAQAAIVAAGSALDVGENVYLQRLEAAVQEATSGVARVVVTAVVSNSTPAAGAYTSADIPIGPRQRARFALERVTVS